MTRQWEKVQGWQTGASYQEPAMRAADEAFARNISAALAMVTSEVPDPWADA